MIYNLRSLWSRNNFSWNQGNKSDIIESKKNSQHFGNKIFIDRTT